MDPGYAPGYEQYMILREVLGYIILAWLVLTCKP